MKARLARARLALQAARELGYRRLAWYALYRLGHISGHYRRVTPIRPLEPVTPEDRPFPEILTIPNLTELLDVDQWGALLAEANQIVDGQVRLFGGDLSALELCPPGPAVHWTAAERLPGIEDIKFIWEPARMGWAYVLGRAFLISGDETYAGAFWQHIEAFLECNPPNQGANWASAQEVALRILAMTFAGQVFAPSEHTTAERMGRLRAAMAAHAQRIPVTMPYARAQNNNHWITEAAGLYTAGVVLSDHPQAGRWKTLGWDELNYALQRQINEEGEYVQHSTNYHRLMLQTALWVLAVARYAGDTYPPDTLDRLAAASKWLYEYHDPLSGHASNLGHNDGAYILPLATGGYEDYRPVLQAAALAFLQRPVSPPGAWDEFTRWLNIPYTDQSATLLRLSSNPTRLGDWRTWGSLRVVHFDERPAHADQLHVDMWWKGHNVALDAGTYRYNAPTPWDNSLTSSLVHNTITIDGKEQMQRISKFLWLQWAQGKVIESLPNLITAEHDGYAQLGVKHRRSLVQLDGRRWRINDALLPINEDDQTFTARLHWLLPDWEWSLDGCALSLTGPPGRMVVALSLAEDEEPSAGLLQLVRCGEALFGPPAVRPILGWHSPTYAQKIPALSYSMTVNAQLPLHITTHWTFDA